MKVERVEKGPVTVLRLEGDIDENGVNDLRTALLRCIKDKRSNVVLNLAKVRFISYLGAGVLVERLRQLRAFNGDIKLVRINLYTDRLFRMTGIGSLFDTFDTESQAIQVFREAA